MNNHTIYRIKITTANRVRLSGLPSFSGFEDFTSVREAAQAIFDQAYDIIDREVAEAPDMPHDDEAFLVEFDKRMAAYVDEIEKAEGWWHDGVQYSIVAITEDENA